MAMPVLASQREAAWIVGTPSGAYRDLMTTRAIDDVDTAAFGWIWQTDRAGSLLAARHVDVDAIGIGGIGRTSRFALSIDPADCDFGITFHSMNLTNLR
jgi:hypothetical protein